MTTKHSQKKKMDFRDKKKTRTVEIEVNNVDVEVVEIAEASPIEEE